MNPQHFHFSQRTLRLIHRWLCPARQPRARTSVNLAIGGGRNDLYGLEPRLPTSGTILANLSDELIAPSDRSAYSAPFVVTGGSIERAKAQVPGSGGSVSQHNSVRQPGTPSLVGPRPWALATQAHANNPAGQAGFAAGQALPQVDLARSANLTEPRFTALWESNLDAALAASTRDSATFGADLSIAEWGESKTAASARRTFSTPNSFSSFELPPAGSVPFSSSSMATLGADTLSRRDSGHNSLAGNHQSHQRFGSAALVDSSPWTLAALSANADFNSSQNTANRDLNGNKLLSGWLKAVYNGSIQTSGLNVVFDRDTTITTFDQTWANDQPRFGDTIGFQPTVATTLKLPSSQFLDIVGSGWDLDGTTPLLTVYNKSSQVMQWYRGQNWSLVNSISLTTNADLMRGSVPGKYFRPRAGIIHEGLQVVLTARWDIATAQTDGIGFFYTQNYGATWSEVPNVAPGSSVGIDGHPDSLGLDRVDRWSFANAFPGGSADSQTDAWFPWSDYIKNDGNTKGGQVGIFRATRSAVGSPWELQANRVIWNRWETLDSGGLHAHGATFHGPQNTILSWWGDVGHRNEIVAHRFDDLENYTTSNITLNRQAYGGYTGDPNINLYSNQSAGFAPGPTYGTAIAASDENPERFVIVSVDETGTKAQLQPVMSSSTNQTKGTGFVGRLSLWIHHLRGVGYVSREIGTVTFGNDNRTLVSSDGLVWTKLQSKSGGTPFIFGNEIAFSSATGDGVRVRPWLPITPFQPLLLSPGGWNRQANTLAQRTAPPAGSTVREVYIDGNGVYRYLADDQPLTPQPEGKPPVSPDSPLLEIALTTNRSAGTRWLMPPGEETAFNANHFWQGYVYPLEQRGLRTTYRMGVLSNANLTSERGPDAMANGQWMPTYHYGAADSADSGRGFMSFFQMNPGPNRWLVAGQSLTAGSHPTYPLSPGQQGEHETVTLKGFRSLGSWSSLLSFGLPAVGFDAWGSNGATQLKIATFWADAQNFAELVYLPNSRHMRLQVSANGTIIGSRTLSGIWLSKQDRVDIVISKSTTNLEFTMALPQDNSDPLVHTVSFPVTMPALREIRLSNPNQTEVVPLQWYASHVHPTRYFSAANRLALLKSRELWT